MPRFGGHRADDDENESKLQDLLSLYNAIKEEETERDKKIEEIDFEELTTYIELCIELRDKKSKYSRRLIRLPNIGEILILMTKTHYSDNDNLKTALDELIDEYYDEPIYTPLLKHKYIAFLKEIINRVDLDSKERADILKSIKKAGKMAGGAIPEIESDLKTYARSKFATNVYDEKEIKDAEKDEKDISDAEEDIYSAFDDEIEELDR